MIIKIKITVSTVPKFVNGDYAVNRPAVYVIVMVFFVCATMKVDNSDMS